MREVMDIETAAIQEAAAEQNRKKAEDAWRRAWWETTLALAAVEGGQGAVARAFERVAPILGQSHAWLRDRRLTGARLRRLEPTKIISLPPRLAVQYAMSGGDPDRAFESLADAEDRGLSLRDFAAELGTQPKSWLRENEQDQRPLTPERVEAALDKFGPVVKGGILRRTMTREVAEEVFNAPGPEDKSAAQARMHAGNAISRHDQRVEAHITDRRHQEAVAAGSTDQEGLPEIARMMTALAEVVIAGGMLARKRSEGATFSERTRQALASYASRAKATIEWLEGIDSEERSEDIDNVLQTWAAEQ